MAKLHIHIIDAFTTERFKGNSAGVIICEKWLSTDLMQSIAMENNLSETAFLVRDKQRKYTIRWFSPIAEIAFCGHATLASAFVLFQQSSGLRSVTFTANAVGEMTVVNTDEGVIEMSFPNRRPQVVDHIPQALYDGLSMVPTEVLRNEQAYFAVYHQESDVRAVEQNPALLKTLAPYDVVVTAPGITYDFVSRYFWPANGGDEDPVTGSIHTGLAPYWAEKLHKTTLHAYQASKRGGALLCRVEGNTVVVSGNAVGYLEGYIDI